MQAFVLEPQSGILASKIDAGMRGRRLRIRAPRRPRIPPAAGIAPGPQHRSGDTELPGNLAQRSATARQHSHRLSFKLIREL
jgi:hypothetical protein